MERPETVPVPMPVEKQATLGLLAVCVAVSFWGYSAVAIKAVSATGAVTAFYRLWFAIPILWIFVLSTRDVRTFTRQRSWLLGSLAGGLLFATHQLFFFTAVNLTSIANVTIIGALQPVLVMVVAARVFAEPASWGVVGASLIAIAGTTLVVWGSLSEAEAGLGDLLALGNLFAFTGYFLASKRAREGVGTAEYVVGMTTVAGIAMGVACWLLGEDLRSPSRNDLLVMGSLALFPGILGHVLTNWAHAHVSALRISMVLLAAPVVATASAAFFLGEAITALQVLGFLIVLSSIAVVVFSREPDEAESLAESVAGTEAP